MPETTVLEGFLPNYMTKFEIGPSKEELFEMAEGIQSVEPANDEETEDYTYYSHKGGKETDVTSVSRSESFKGHRTYKLDEAQEFIRNGLNSPGQGRKCYFRVTEPDGRIVEGPASFSGIVHRGGDANSRGNFEVTVTFDGLPEDKLPSN
ncbi:major capsid protein gpP [Carnobacterium maltaromaticum LMA28]|uniref:Major capsid protein gpP n=1 Tax=Carnobacterium maltaromaticum LMA28 TaxID=1234679 RepID=K8ESL4_CARML|nr:hypothetical protein [Carnobacterium maltaromaticum]CCO11576.2 major capsid protein gpP [Carnobacterium maltaromaticum LMA28]